MNIIRKLMLLPCLLSLPSMAAELDDILRLNTEAVGGQENWARIENVRFQLGIREPGFEVDRSDVGAFVDAVRLRLGTPVGGRA